MREKLDKEIKLLRTEILLFSAVFLAMLFSFYGIFKNAALPGWDTPSHFFALSKMTEYLFHGHITGYLNEWLGGIPLFQFYAPLYFIIVGGFWLLTFKLVPLFLLFRISIFILIFCFSVSFWYFLKSYFGRQVAMWGIPLSAVFIFYPKIYSVFGIGAGAAIWAGLITSMAGIIFVLLWLSFLENLRKRPDSEIYFLLTALSIAGLILTHTLSFIAGLIFFGVYFIFNIRDKKIVLRAPVTFFLGLGLSAFWFIPFIANNQLSSAEIRGAWDLTISPFYLLFPLKIPYLGFGSALLFVLAFAGLYLLIKERKFIAPLLFGGIVLFFIARTQFSLFFSEFTVHYQRFLPFIFIFILAGASYALNWLWQYWAETAPRRKAYLCLLVFFLVFDFFYTFDIKTVISNDTDSNRQPLLWQWNDFEYADEAKKLLVDLKELKDSERIFVQLPPTEGLGYLGSLHYFSSELPLQNNQSIINGLYVESSPLTPYIMPVIDALTSGQVQAYGDMRLQLVRPFYEQDFKIHLARLKKFGVNYVVAYSPGFAVKLEGTGEALKVGGTEHFKIYKISGAYPLAYGAKFKPAIYLNLGGGPSFRDLSMALFAGEKTFDYPVAEGKYKISHLNKDLLNDFSVIIVGGKNLDEGDIKALNDLGHPLVILNNFETISKLRKTAYKNWPSGWAELMSAMEANMSNFIIEDPGALNIEEYSGEKIRISGQGPVIINGGYFPYWQYESCATCKVWRVTPDQMLIFADGEESLVYKADATKKNSVIVSILALLVWLGYAAFIWLGRRKFVNKVK